MEYRKTKEYELRFVIDKEVNLKINSSVAITDSAPTNKDDFYWVESISHEPTGFMYKLYGVDRLFHECELYPLLPVVVSDDILHYDDLFYYNGKVYTCAAIFLDDETTKWMISDKKEEKFFESDVLKVVASTEAFCWIYSEGPPHDHSYDWVGSSYLEDYIETILIDIVKNDFKLDLIVHELCLKHIDKDCTCKNNLSYVVKTHKGKIIVDHYKLLTKD
jgi:hypothetical protein